MELTTALLTGALTVIGSLAGVAVGQYLAGRNQLRRLQHDAEERARDREHERHLRELELLDQHRARLLSERLAAYRRFATAHLERRRAEEAVDTALGHQKYLTTRKEPFTTEELQGAVDRRDAAWNRSHKARLGVEAAAIDIQLIGSQPVREAVGLIDVAVENLRKAYHEYREQQDWGEGRLGGPDEWAAVSRAREEFDEAEDALLEAISAELDLDR